MEKVKITLDEYASLKEACFDIAQKLGLNDSHKEDLEAWKQALMQISSDIVIELRQINTIPEEVLMIPKLLEDIQQHNEHIYLIRGIG